MSGVYSDIINHVAQYVYDNSERVINLDELASYTGYSKYHFNRIFYSATGYQLGEFIQRRKLEKALYSIKQGNHNLIEVALSIGYDSPSSFSRAFKKHFALTPSDVVSGRFPSNDRASHLLPKKPSFNPALQPKWHVLPEQRVYGLYGCGFNQQSFSLLASELFAQLASRSELASFTAVKPIGVSIDNPWVGEQQKSRFFCGFLDGLATSHTELDSFSWQAGKWASFKHLGPHNSMWRTISQIYAQWVIPNRIKLKDQQIIQCYLNNPVDTPAEDLQTELYFAIG
ncbi:helix-turn-helix domain-containing protein (plasmid) [Pseudoalteromonas sp. T1lg65]|uniref:helix-turn-helix domain-containing protein n=1 Tax=Pseudoalteromonas sp. T1lg65 TaxID=2077101 RepID=UPI003F7A9BFA